MKMEEKITRAALLRKATAELIGTFTMVFAGCGAIMVHGLYPATLPAVAIPVVFGLVVAAMVYALGHISGAHLNPAVTIAFAAVRRFSWCEVPLYVAAQLLGALLAIALLAYTLPESNNYGATLPSIALVHAFIWEFVLTFFLMFVIIAVATDARAVGVMAGAAIGATVMLDAFIGGALTGASMNPARSIAPALFAGNIEVLWLYIAAPIAGALAAAFLYELIRCEPKQDRKHVKGCC